VTCHAIKRANKLTSNVKEEEKKAKVREQARLRKKKQRKKESLAKAIVEEAPKNKLLNGQVSNSELEQLLAQTKIRDFDCPTEYLMTLVRIDGDRITHDQSAIGTCNSCKLPLPVGCNKTFKGQFDCSYIQGLPIVELRNEK
jgi:phage/plasmid primase-like uncharacterized protein